MGKGNQGKILEIAHSSDLNEARSLLMHLSIKKQSNLIIIINFLGHNKMEYFFNLCNYNTELK